VAARTRARRGVAPVAVLDITMPEPRSVALVGFAPDGPVRVLREIPGLPAAVWADEYRAVADAGGRVVLDVGPGALWSLDADGAARRLDHVRMARVWRIKRTAHDADGEVSGRRRQADTSHARQTRGREAASPAPP